MDSVTGSPANFALAVLADNHTSLMHGWVPGIVQALAVTLLARWVSVGGLVSIMRLRRRF